MSATNAAAGREEFKQETRMKLLLTNDDGIEARGLHVLAKAVSSLGELTVAAPHVHLSGCSHQTVTDRTIEVRKLDSGRYAVEAMPADCVRLGLLHLADDTDWVLSGINEGGNLGVDVFMSGTVAAVREAAIIGRPGIAFSQFRRTRADVDWDQTAEYLHSVLQRIWSEPVEAGVFWNVNFPDPTDCSQTPEIVDCPIDQNGLPVEYHIKDDQYRYRGVYQNRRRSAGSDVDCCFSGNISISRVSVF